MYLKNITILLLVLSIVSREAQCVYLKQNMQKDSSNNEINFRHKNTAIPWNLLKIKLGLNDQKIEILKSQKDQKTTMELIKQFIKENPNFVYMTANAPNNHQNADNASNKQSKNVDAYQTVVQMLDSSNNKLKTVIHLEMNDVLKRVPRKISVQMVSDMPTDKIDDLLKAFNEQHNLDKDPFEDADRSYDNDGDDVDDEMYDSDYADMDDSDYVKENHYEHDQDQSAIGGHSSQYKYNSISDLIMRSQKMQWQQNPDDMKIQLDKKYLV